jgi:hypothetical protein
MAREENASGSDNLAAVDGGFPRGLTVSFISGADSCRRFRDLPEKALSTPECENQEIGQRASTADHRVDDALGVERSCCVISRGNLVRGPVCLWIASEACQERIGR